MSGPTDWNAKIIAEFRANKGHVGPPFEGAPLTLVHHCGRRSGREYVNPVMYLQPDEDSTVMYIFATKSGAPTHPGWYANLMHAGSADVEVGTEAFPVSVSELTGAERDRVYAEQARRYPGFGEYAKKTEGIRTIPVIQLRRL
jgi:deazaflavin-dependent oxidoreductase (nitroreductase family)